MNEREYEEHDARMRREEKAASYDKPAMCPCKLTMCDLHYWCAASNSFRIKVMK
jgi:hypothetical protein